MRALIPIAIWAAIVCLAVLAQWKCNDAWSIQRTLGVGRVGWPLICGGLVIALIVSWVAFTVQSRLAARAEVVNHGVPTTARILHLRQLGTAEDASYAYVEAVVEFDTAAGQSVQASARFNLAYVLAPQYQPGNVIRIHYDQAEPTRVAIEDAR